MNVRSTIQNDILKTGFFRKMALHNDTSYDTFNHVTTQIDLDFHAISAHFHRAPGLITKILWLTIIKTFIQAVRIFSPFLVTIATACVKLFTYTNTGKQQCCFTTTPCLSPFHYLHPFLFLFSFFLFKKKSLCDLHIKTR